MPSTTMRRPLPALVFLLALTLLAALVWWRVLTRSQHNSAGTAHCSSTPAGTTVLPAPPTVTVIVLNSTHRTGIAAAVRTVLVQDGFQSPDLAANDRTVKAPIAGVAEIRYAPAQLPAAKLLRYYLPGATLKQMKTTSGKVVVSLGNRYRAVATPAAVSAAQARDHVTVQRVASATSTSAAASC
jgi:hypothetical protein